jgi:uracil-DNA glycosylase
MYGPRSHRDPAKLQEKMALLREPHIAVLTAFVEQLRAEWPTRDIPWFDPVEAGVTAPILILLEAPGRRARSSGFISPDNDDGSAANMWDLLNEAKIVRASDVVTWNVVPWYIGDATRIKASTHRDHAEAADALRELLRLLPEVRVVLLLGQKAQRAWDALGPRGADSPTVLKAPHPSPRNLNSRPRYRGKILERLIEARSFVRAGA